ncbi:MAG: hypothetical protein J6X60_09960 [Ruminiclostridium sp.]|nr:hypothetical protein [Ruminiclostridium sp.]
MLYIQTVIKSEKAAAQVSFISAEAMTSAETAKYRDVVPKEEDDFRLI